MTFRKTLKAVAFLMSVYPRLQNYLYDTIGWLGYYRMIGPMTIIMLYFTMVLNSGYRMLNANKEADKMASPSSPSSNPALVLEALGGLDPLIQRFPTN